MKTEIIPSIFTVNNGMKLEISKRRKMENSQTWKFANTLMNNYGSKKKLKGK